MSLPVVALAQYVEVLDQRAQQSMAEAARARALLVKTQSQLERLHSMAHSAGVKKLHGNVALYANAAGFRSGLMDMAGQCKDVCGVQQLEYAQASAHMQAALRQHDSMQSVLERARADMAQLAQRKAQNAMDELAGQAWQRQARQQVAGNR